MVFRRDSVGLLDSVVARAFLYDAHSLDRRSQHPTPRHHTPPTPKGMSCRYICTWRRPQRLQVS